MPSLITDGENVTPNKLAHKVDKSRRAVQWHSATYHAEVLPRLRKLSLYMWRQAIVASDPAERIALSREWRELIELRRQLLGFPSPGRRRDEGESERKANAQSGPTVLEVASVSVSATPSPATTQPVTEQSAESTQPSEQPGAPTEQPGVASDPAAAPGQS
jgi:hypothetical protein